MSTSRTPAQLHRDRSLFMSSFYGESDIIIERPARQKWSTSNKRTGATTKPTKNSSYEDTEDCSETSIMSYGDDTSSSLQVYEIKEVPAAAEILPGKQRTKSLAEIYNRNKKKIHARSNQSHFASDGAIRSRTTVHLSPPSPPSISSSSKRIWKTSGAGRTAKVGTPVNKQSSSSMSSSMEVSSSRGDCPLKPSEIAKQERTKSLSSLRHFNVSQRNLSTDRPLFHDDSTSSSTTTTTSSSSRPGWSSTQRNWKSVSNLRTTGPKLNLQTKGQGSQKQDEEEERTHAMTVDTEATAASSDAGISSASSSTASCALIHNLPDFSQGRVPSRRTTTTTTNRNDDPYVRLLVDDLTSAPRWTNN